MYRCRCVRAAATSENKENKIQKQPNNNRETYVIAITQWIFTWCSCCRLLVWSFFSSSFTDSVSWNKNNPLTTQNLSYSDSKSRFILILFYFICKNLLQNQLKTSNKIELQQPNENVNSEQFQCGNEKKQQEKEKITQNKLKSKQRRNRKKWWKRLSRRAAASQCKGSSNGTKTKKKFQFLSHYLRICNCSHRITVNAGAWTWQKQNYSHPNRKQKLYKKCHQSDSTMHLNDFNWTATGKNVCKYISSNINLLMDL